MRAVRALTGGSGFSADQPWLPGLPHVAAALATYFVFGGQACVTGLAAGDVGEFRCVSAGDGAGVERRTADRRGYAGAGADGAGAVRAAGVVDVDSLGRGRVGRVGGMTNALWFVGETAVPVSRFNKRRRTWLIW